MSDIAFNDSQRPVSSGIAVHESQAQDHIKAQIWLAKEFPRDEVQARRAIVEACKRPKLAKKGRYEFQRGKQMVTGMSVHAARELAGLWQHMRCGFHVINDTGDRIHIKGFALDMQRNVYFESEDSFKTLIYRKGKDGQSGAWVEPDERDRRELINRRAAIAVRNAILQVLPGDIVEDAERLLEETERNSARTALRDRKTAQEKLIEAFGYFHVTPEMIEHHLGHPLKELTEEELVHLRGVWNTIKDDNGRVEEFFPKKTASPPAAEEQDDSGKARKAQQLRDKAKRKKGEEPEPEPESAEPEYPDDFDHDPIPEEEQEVES